MKIYTNVVKNVDLDSAEALRSKIIWSAAIAVLHSSVSMYKCQHVLVYNVNYILLGPSPSVLFTL